MDLLLSDAALRWVPAALNGTVRGVVLTVLVAAVLAVCRRANAATRYRVWWSTLLLVALFPLLAGYAEPGHQFAPAAESRQAAADAGEAVNAGAAHLPEQHAPDVIPADAEAASVGVRHAGAEAPGIRRARRMVAVPRGIAAVLLALWTVGTLWSWLRLCGQARAIVCLRRGALDAGSDWQRDAERLARAIRLHPVDVLLSDDVAVPVTIGWLRPAILIPFTLRSVPAAARAQVLVHELAHLHRRDHWMNLAQRVLESALFFHPACRWIGRRLRLERELACDDWVLALTGATRGAYARLLLGLGESALSGCAATPAGALSMGAQLRTRVQRLLRSGAQQRPRAGALHTAVLAGIAAALAIPMSRVPQVAALEAPPAPLAHPGAATLLAGAHGLAGEEDGAGMVLGAAGLAADSVLRALADDGFRGTALVAVGGAVVLHRAYGDADPIAGLAGSTATLHNAGAFAKTLTAAAILALEQDGRLRTSDAVARYLGPFPGIKATVTIHQLLIHTGGIAQRFAPVGREDRDAFIRAIKATPPENPPGAATHYTDFGHAVLAALVEVVSGEPYESFVRRRLLIPAGIADDAGFEPEFAADQRTRFREFTAPLDGGDPLLEARVYRWGRRGAMGAVATVRALYRWTLAMEHDRVLSRPARERMLAPHSDTGRGTFQGYGWETGVSADGSPFHHRLSGWPGNSVEIFRSVQDNVAIVLAGNLPANWVTPNYVRLRAAVLSALD